MDHGAPIFLDEGWGVNKRDINWFFSFKVNYQTYISYTQQCPDIVIHLLPLIVSRLVKLPVQSQKIPISWRMNQLLWLVNRLIRIDLYGFASVKIASTPDRTHYPVFRGRRRLTAIKHSNQVFVELRHKLGFRIQHPRRIQLIHSEDRR